MYGDQEQEQDLKMTVSKRRFTFIDYIKMIILLLVVSSVVSFGLIGMIHYYFGEEGARFFIQAFATILVIILVWGIIIVTTAVSNKHTQNVVRNVTHSIVETQTADDRGEVARMMAMIYRQQMMDQHNYNNRQHISYPPNQIEYYQGNYPAKPIDDRFDYEGHLSIDDVWTKPSGLK